MTDVNIITWQGFVIQLALILLVGWYLHRNEDKILKQLEEEDAKRDNNHE